MTLRDWTLKHGVWVCNKHNRALEMPASYAQIMRSPPYPRFCRACRDEERSAKVNR